MTRRHQYLVWVLNLKAAISIQGTEIAVVAVSDCTLGLCKNTAVPNPLTLMGERCPHASIQTDNRTIPDILRLHGLFALLAHPVKSGIPASGQRCPDRDRDKTHTGRGAISGSFRE